MLGDIAIQTRYILTLQLQKLPLCNNNLCADCTVYCTCTYSAQAEFFFTEYRSIKFNRPGGRLYSNKAGSWPDRLDNKS